MSREDIIKKEVLEYLDFMLLGFETINHPDISDQIKALDKKVNVYEEELREKYSLSLKR